MTPHSPKTAICEFGYILSRTHKQGRKRCRKHATTMLSIKTQFGTQITATGEIPIYMTKYEYRCNDHKEEK